MAGRKIDGRLRMSTDRGGSISLPFRSGVIAGWRVGQSLRSAQSAGATVADSEVCRAPRLRRNGVNDACAALLALLAATGHLLELVDALGRPRLRQPVIELLARFLAERLQVPACAPVIGSSPRGQSFGSLMQFELSASTGLIFGFWAMPFSFCFLATNGGDEAAVPLFSGMPDWPDVLHSGYAKA